MKVAVVGSGYVGLVTGACFSELGHEVTCVDNNAEKIRVLRQGGVPIYEAGLPELLARNVKAGRLQFSTDTAGAVKGAEVVFIAVNTPRLPSGNADLQYVEKVAREIAQAMDSYKVIVEKSTVPVNTGLKVAKTIERHVKPGVEFDVVSNPEFLREGAAIADAMNPDRIVVGVSSPRAEAVMRALYEKIKAPFIVTDINSAELIKHASNSFLALKISYINAVANICELAGANVEEVARGMGLDKRIGAQFLKPGLGYGGSCFPKDVDAFERLSRELGYDFGLLREVQSINRLQRSRFIKKIKEALWVLKDKKIAVLGLAFKPGTDDIREAPAVEIIQAILDEGGGVRAFDPQAAHTMKAVFPDLTYCKTAKEALTGADAAVIVTEWDEIAGLDPLEMKRWMAHPVVLDGRNVFDPGRMKEAGLDYVSIGR